MALQLHSADFLHDDGVTYCIRRERLDQDFTIYEKRDGAWIDSGLDQAVKNVNFDEVKRLGLLIKRIMDADRWVAEISASMQSAAFINTAVVLLIPALRR